MDAGTESESELVQDIEVQKRYDKDHFSTNFIEFLGAHDMNNKIINICLGLAAAISVWSCDKIAEIESRLLTVETLGYCSRESQTYIYYLVIHVVCS